MSREAQTTREKRARIILGEAEVEIATLFEEAEQRGAGDGARGDDGDGGDAAATEGGRVSATTPR